MKRSWVFAILCPLVGLLPCAQIEAQGVSPYPNAFTDRLIHPATPKLPPAVNTKFRDPDFRSWLVRVTDENTVPTRSGSYFLNPEGPVNAWSADERKFYVMREGGVNLAFAFEPATMKISSLSGASPGEGLRIPLRPSPTFSSRNPDLIFGTLPGAPLSIATYRLSTGSILPLIDTKTCGTNPPLAADVTSDYIITASADDNRVLISEGAKAFGTHMFVTVYDKRLGCRWYNTQTGQIGGQWGIAGYASIGDRYLIRHAVISGNGRYVRISVDNFGFYVWDVASLKVTACPNKGGPLCAGYGALGYSSYVNAAGEIDEMNTLKRPLGNLGVTHQLVHPLPLPHYWEMEKRFAWSNGRLNNNAPVCGTTYSYDGDTVIARPYDGEIFCIESDGLQSTIWRFAHNRTVWDPSYYYTAPFVSISPTGRFLLFTSSWDNQLGTGRNGGPRTDVWIINLD